MDLKGHFGDRSHEAAIRQMTLTLIEKIASSAVVADQAAYKAFQAEIDSIRSQFSSTMTAELLLLQTGFAAQALQTYNRGVAAFFWDESRVMKEMLDIVLTALAAIGREDAPVLTRKHKNDSALATDATRSADRLSALRDWCNRVVRDVERQRYDTENAIHALRREVEKGAANPSLTESASLDTITGLRSMSCAVNAMRRPVPPGTRRYVFVIVVDRIQAVNARFGQDTGDSVLRAFARHVSAELGGKDLYRWSGPAFVALLDRCEPLAQVRLQLRHALDAHLEETFDVDGRDVLIPVSANWSAFELTGSQGAAERQIRTFIAGQDTSTESCAA